MTLSFRVPYEWMNQLLQSFVGTLASRRGGIPPCALRRDTPVTLGCQDLANSDMTAGTLQEAWQKITTFV